ncbi:head-tail adaptor protein [Thetidibacter halocola]|uniref:Head-tail adaptor protein n=1 Tax=Thetidibacter halocola TaxID=2827239 RepID=A0A8J7WD39_9RHOB|nr:head-tail adaptor protein [Thetidibacter halocola]MBS0124244.1 head-tail adaptor protein [Thetidibacter halocola]
MSRPNLTRRLILEAPVQLPDGAGGYTESWSALGTLWAEINPRFGRFASAVGGTVSVTAALITVRAAPVGHSNRPVPGQRFRNGSRVFTIEAVSEADARAMFLECQCKEEIAA